MTLTLQIVLFVISIITFLFVINKIRKSQLNIGDAVVWILLSLLLIVMSLCLPFINKMYNATNRVIWNTTLAFTDKKSPVEVTENYQKFDFSTSLDYELSQNLRFTVGGGLTVLQHAYVKTEDYVAYNVAANVTVQF